MYTKEFKMFYRHLDFKKKVSSVRGDFFFFVFFFFWGGGGVILRAS